MYLIIKSCWEEKRVDDRDIDYPAGAVFTLMVRLSESRKCSTPSGAVGVLRFKPESLWIADV